MLVKRTERVRIVRGGAVFTSWQLTFSQIHTLPGLFSAFVHVLERRVAGAYSESGLLAVAIPCSCSTNIMVNLGNIRKWCHG